MKVLNSYNSYVVGVDFDGTACTHEYPNVGQDIGAVPVLLELVAEGHKLILYTMRSGKELDDAVEWFTSNNIPLYGVNNNPTQHEWTSSPKVYCHLYIDDSAIGTPLIEPLYVNKGSFRFNDARPYVDWIKVRELLVQKGVLKAS